MSDRVPRGPVNATPAPTGRRVLFIDGPLAGQLHVIPADRSVWLALQQVRDPEAIYPWDVSNTEICYQPIGLGAQHHDPQPWTCQRRPDNEVEQQHALAKAWCHLHGPERQ